jgi:hypothetical protein
VDGATFERIRPSTAIGEIDADTSKPHSAENTERSHYFGQGSFADNDLFAAAPFDRDRIFIPWCHAEAHPHNRHANKALSRVNASWWRAITTVRGELVHGQSTRRDTSSVLS